MNMNELTVKLLEYGIAGTVIIMLFLGIAHVVRWFLLQCQKDGIFGAWLQSNIEVNKKISDVIPKIVELQSRMDANITATTASIVEIDHSIQALREAALLSCDCLERACLSLEIPEFQDDISNIRNALINHKGKKG